MSWKWNNCNGLGLEKMSGSNPKAKFTTNKLIPESLKSIFCSCEKGRSSAKCIARKHGLKCTNLLSKCYTLENFSNAELQRFSIDYSDWEKMEMESSNTEAVIETFENNEELVSFLESDEEAPHFCTLVFMIAVIPIIQ